MGQTGIQKGRVDMTTNVVNLRTSNYDVYIGRAGHGKDGYFGNPFTIAPMASRETVIERYRAYAEKRMTTDPEFRRRVRELQGKTLGCFCKPLPCHGDVLAELAERAYADELWNLCAEAIR